MRRQDDGREPGGGQSLLTRHDDSVDESPPAPGEDGGHLGQVREVRSAHRAAGGNHRMDVRVQQVGVRLRELDPHPRPAAREADEPRGDQGARLPLPQRLADRRRDGSR